MLEVNCLRMALEMADQYISDIYYTIYVMARIASTWMYIQKYINKVIGGVQLTLN